MAVSPPAAGSEATRGRVLVGTRGPEVLLQVEGRGTHLNSQPLRDFLTQMVERGYRLFRLELGQCQSLDSTFLGVLASTCLRLKSLSGRFSVCGASSRNLDLLKTLGIDRFFDLEPAVEAGPPLPPALTALEPAVGDSQAWGATMLEAHRTLTACDARNIPRFKDVIEYLEEDLSRHAGPLPAQPPGHRQQ